MQPRFLTHDLTKLDEVQIDTKKMSCESCGMQLELIQTWGNEVEETSTDPETWNTPEFKREVVSDPKHPEKPPDPKITE